VVQFEVKGPKKRRYVNVVPAWLRRLYRDNRGLVSDGAFFVLAAVLIGC
jgi:hypothetical protein